MQNYSYHENIKPPDSLGASPKGDLTSLGNNIKALTGYVDVLVSGNSKAQRVSPLGNKYFMNTGTTCKDMNGVSQARYAYINNVPSGNIPIMSSAMGGDMTEFRGLVPGVLENMGYLDPTAIFTAFNADTTCQEITMDTRDVQNQTATESRYVTQADIKGYDPCWFPNKKNPVTNAACSEGMQNMGFNGDPVLHLYFALVGGLGVYLVYSFMKIKG
jgi:hypothetical protein